MEKRALGRSGLTVSALGFGAMTFSHGEGNYGRMGALHGAQAERIVDLCLDHGVTLFDTADAYSAGGSEQILGEALGKRRRDAVVATKAFFRVGPGDHDIGLSRRHLVEACEASLRRLDTDWIDLYQLHSFDALVPLEETLRALDDLVTAGKVRYIGCSNFSGWHLMKAQGISEREGLARFVGQQIQYSLMVRDAEWDLLPCGIDQGVGALIWSPLAQGFLSGKFRTPGGSEGTRLGSREALGGWDTPEGNRVLDALFAVAEECEASPSQVALAWLLGRPGVTSLLLGARSEEQLVDNLGAAHVTLSAGQVEALDRASQSPLIYPNSHHRLYAHDRNPAIFPRYE